MRGSGQGALSARGPEGNITVDDYRHVLAELYAKCTQNMDELAKLADQTVARIEGQPREYLVDRRLGVLLRVNAHVSATSGKQDCSLSFAGVEFLASQPAPSLAGG